MISRHITTFAAAASVLALFATPVSAGTATDPNDVVKALTARMDAVAAFQAHVQADIAMHTFPYLQATLTGTAKYQRPAKYSVTFDQVPELASAFQKVSGDIGDPAVWPEKYNIKIDPSSSAAAPGHIVLRLTQKVRGQIDHVLAFVDLQSETVTRMEWYYYSGGKITVDQEFAPQGGVLLVDHQDVEINMPGYKATIQAQFNDYTVQVSMIPAASH